MLKGLSSPKISPESAPSHEDLFMQRYERLLKAARRLTNGDERAQDLVHNSFVHFVLCRPDIASIKDLDGYLLTTLRNMNISQARRAALIKTEPLSPADFDSADDSLRATDAQAQLQVREQLRLICDYACRRKDSSKIGSALILRFFHGYYPTEVAQVFNATRVIVENWLWRARQEARSYVEDPTSILLIEGQSSSATNLRTPLGGSAAEFLSELRRNIFSAKVGHCLSPATLKKFYSEADAKEPDINYLGHLVSCAECLEEVNTHLGLPSLEERFPMETFGRDPKPPGPKIGGGDGGSTVGGGGLHIISRLKQASRRRAKGVLEHRPKELHVAVNGYVLGSQGVAAESNSLALNVNLGERVGFVEVFSEQGFRLMFANVDLPPDGALEQSNHVEFSEGRSLDLDLDFTGQWPTVNLVYNDPTFNAVQPSATTESQIDPLPGSVIESADDEKVRGTQTLIGRALSTLRRLRNYDFWLRPATVTFLVALFIGLGIFLMNERRKSEAPITAGELLARATAVEEAIASRPEQVVHRTIELVESVPGGSGSRTSTYIKDTAVTRRRIEVWQSAEKGITARRLYDETGVLIAGEWRKSDGTRTVYNHRPSKQASEPQLEIANLAVWQLDLSAKDLTSLLGSSGASVQENPSDYIVTLTRTETSVVTKAILTLNRDDLHARQLALFVERAEETREYRFSETSFERRSKNAVAPSVFEPEPQLNDAATGRSGEAANVSTSPNLPLAVSPVLATAATEIEVLRLLNSAGADLGEQVSVERNSVGQLRVEGIVETEQRKRELLSTLAPVVDNPAVKIQISTVAEALALQRQARNSALTTIEPSEVTASAIPVDADLRRYFSAKGASVQVDDEIRRYATRIRSRSQDVMTHAYALKHLVNRFSPNDLSTLDAEARTKWLGLISQHAQVLQRQTQTIREELQPIFFSGSETRAGDAFEIRSDADIVRAVDQLFELCSANDKVIRSAFSISPDRSRASALRTAAFWGSLKSIERCAARIQSVKY